MTVDPATAAFRRLLADGASGGQAKVDALVALSQRTVFVATWTPGGDDFRTLVNSNGQNALPLFTDPEQLQLAGQRLGWVGPDGSVTHREVGARQAFTHLVSHSLGFLIVDIASEHSLEAERAEIEPLLSSRRTDSAGPFAAVGRISETMLQAVKPTPRPMEAVKPPTDLPPGAMEGGLPAAGARPPSTPPSSPPGPPPGVTATTSKDGVSPQATFGSGASSVSVQPMTDPPPDALLDALSAVLRGFPEVEWASFFVAARGPTDARPTVGLRVDTSYRQRINEIIRGLRDAADGKGATVDVMLLDDPKLVRDARSQAIVFFPWRRRPTT